MLSLPIRTFPTVRSAVGENTEKATALRSLKKSVLAQYLIAGNGEMDRIAHFLVLEFLLVKAVVFAGTVHRLLINRDDNKNPIFCNKPCN